MPANAQEIDLTGRKWEAKLNGRNTLNGQRYGATHYGTIDAGSGTLFDVVRELADEIEGNSDMEYPDSIQITIHPPEKQEATKQ